MAETAKNYSELGRVIRNIAFVGPRVFALASIGALFCGLIMMWLTVLGAVILVLSLVLHTAVARLLAGLIGAILAGLWWLLPSCGGDPVREGSAAP